ncbi:coiled-coil domain-containing protein 97 [Diorhabda carinulata]|uniref:coiled-coil domain-containing protein 97 n=1 Tax=Diorhabda carinulata TaxID=1163345 RepID=UPI00259FE5FE|nr:coiled-coil domain-containing protein 97 [Diorhabda carinulata]
MTVENEPETKEITKIESERDSILTYLAHNSHICFKSQQKWEKDLTVEEKIEIGLELFKNNKLQFLTKFGKYLKYSQLQYFRKVTEYDPNFQDIDIVLNNLLGASQENSHNVIIKNRRYQAMVKMIQETSYFSEIEMMKRNPLLYNQLIGQYLTSDEVKERDRYDKDSSFVKILMEGIERDNAEKVRQQEEEDEKYEMEHEDVSDDESDDIPQPSTSHWGEIVFNRKPQKSINIDHKSIFIKPEERKLLKDEFVTTMYESFLSGKDTDFDYETVDNNTSYDDMDEIDNDEEEKYFDSEEIDENCRAAESSEDELDAYMNTLS